MFQGVLIESLPARKPRNPLLTPFVVLAHAAVVAALVFASAVGPSETPEPPVYISLLLPPEPPRGDSPRGGRDLQTASDRRDRPGSPDPASLPRLPEPAAPTIRTWGSDPEAGSDERRTSGETADDGGRIGPPGSGTGRPDVIDTGGDDPPKIIGGNVRPPELIERVEPLYPEWARKARVEGMVILQAIISASGKVEDVRVLRSVHPLLDAPAVAAVEGWRYRPATLNGRAVRVYLTVTVRFQLN